jgi:glycosyltransferase involved in cell wall biosynthesis
LSADSVVTAVWRKVTQFILNHATTVVVIGRDMADIVRQKLPPSHHNRIVLIPNWSDERRVRPIPPAENEFVQTHNLAERFVVQYAGRMGRTHNLEPIIEAADLMQGTSALFQFVGEGAKKEKLQNMAAERGLKNVQFLPYQPMEKLGEMLSAADIAVVCLDEAFTGMSVPSKSYGIMASGAPILGLVDAQGEIGLMIKELGCGVVVEEQTAVSIAKIIRELMEDAPQLKEMGQAGRNGFMRRYTLSQAASAYDRAILNLAKPAGEKHVSPKNTSTTY